MNVPDRTLDHLREVLAEPDLTGTRYRLTGLVGRGGMGVVYRALDTILEREVALKVIEVYGRGETATREARLLGKLEHPGIVAVHDAGILQDGHPYCVMRLVAGTQLDEFISSAPALAARLSVFEKLCDAIAFAHSRGVIHRDLKQENIVVGSFGEVVVLDWGVALLTGRAEQDGTIAGTSRYMAPEQHLALEVDIRVDVYALGVLLSELLPRNAPAPLRAIAAKACAPERDARYPDVGSLASDVQHFRDHLPVTAHRASPWEVAVRFFARNTVPLLLIAAYVLVRVLLYFFRPG